MGKADEKENTIKTQIDGLTTTLQSSRLELENMKTEVTQFESEHLQLSKQVETDSAAATKEQQAIASAQEKVHKWQGEIDFIEQLTTLNSQLVEMQKIAQDRQAVVDQAEEKLNAAQTVVDEAKHQRKAIQMQSDELQKKILQLRGGG